MTFLLSSDILEHVMSKSKLEGILLWQYLILLFLFLSYFVLGQDDKIIDKEKTTTSTTTTTDAPTTSTTTTTIPSSTSGPVSGRLFHQTTETVYVTKPTLTNDSIDPKIAELMQGVPNILYISDQKDTTITLEHRSPYRRHIPGSFDARNRWPFCKTVIDHIRTQGNCANSWAAASASVISDRICIGSQGVKQIEVSMDDILSCCPNCTVYGEDLSKFCEGGFAWKALHYWLIHGVVSGGEYMSKSGCKPYSEEVYSTRMPNPCVKMCTNPNYTKTYIGDKHFATMIYRLAYNTEEQMQIEIMNNGPVLAFMRIYRDFYNYSNQVYVSTTEENPGIHFVRILGWGETSGKKYWLAANSWGKLWGNLNGFFLILRGKNHNFIESEIRGGKLDTDSPLREWVVLNDGISNRCISFKVTCACFISLLLFLVVSKEI